MKLHQKCATGRSAAAANRKRLGKRRTLVKESQVANPKRRPAATVEPIDSSHSDVSNRRSTECPSESVRS
jgi:hypothetical protein